MDYDKLNNSFFNVASEARKTEYKMENNLEKSLKEFEKNLTASSSTQIEILKSQYSTEFIKLKHTLSKDYLLRSLQDKIFTKHLKLPKQMPTYISDLFENLIKGITYFSHEKENVYPIYHRLYSCGPYEDTHRSGNLICTEKLDKKELIRRRPLIERCYIERLLYDLLYIHESLHFPKLGPQDLKQDDGHIFRMNLTKKDFESCFPSTKIECKIEYDDNFPYKVIITRIVSGKITHMTYIKTFQITPIGNKVYDSMVECIKEEGGNKYFKLCSFQNIGKFKII